MTCIISVVCGEAFIITVITLNASAYCFVVNVHIPEFIVSEFVYTSLMAGVLACYPLHYLCKWNS